jgi:hypothetical protein
MIMAFELVDLDDKTRRHMLAELDHDLASGNLYSGKYLSALGAERYPELLREAIERGTEDSLAAALAEPGLFAESYMKHKPSGGYAPAKVPHTAPTTLAEGEFNRFYLRGLCQRARATEGSEIEIYRARSSAQPRVESEALVGSHLSPLELLQDLREHTGVDFWPSASHPDPTPVSAAASSPFISDGTGNRDDRPSLRAAGGVPTDAGPPPPARGWSSRRPWDSRSSPAPRSRRCGRAARCLAARPPRRAETRAARSCADR